MPFFPGSAIWFCTFLSALGDTQFAPSHVEELETILQSATVFPFTFNTLSKLTLGSVAQNDGFFAF